MTSPADVLNWFRGLIGTGESPAGSNHNFITDWYGLTGPWCAMTCSYALTMAGIDWHWAYVPYAEQAARDGDASCGEWLDGGSANCDPGDLVIFDWNADGVADHIGIVEAINSDNSLVTIEGNTSDVCARRHRTRGTIRGFIRPPYATAVGAAVGAAAGASTTDGRPVLRVGSRGESVRAWQACVGAGQDGIFGADTAEHTKSFQRSNNLTADGVVGPLTYAAMDRTLAYLAGLDHAPAPSSAPPFPGTCASGAHGDKVRLVQQRLADRGWRIDVDGSYGPKTVVVVTAFQQEKGLTADGIVGPDTWNALWTTPVN